MRRCFLMHRNLRRAAAAVAMLALLLSAVAAGAQAPYVASVFPAGGQRGTTVQATVTGLRLQGATDVRIVPQDIVTHVVRVVNSSTMTMSAVIAPGAALGEHDLRIVTPAGASNRYRFFVGQLPEINEKEPNSEKRQAQVLPALPVLVNGQITQGDRDYYRFSLAAGENLVCALDARSIVPYIADAVPGWFDACLTLFDASGKEVAYDDDFRFDPDPQLVYRAPASGDYILEVRDILYRGRGDFVYRLSLGVLPRITHIYPLGGRRGTTARVSLYGANLPAASIDVRPMADSPAVMELSAISGHLASNPAEFGVGDLPEVFETEPNDSFIYANRVQPPVTINGRIDRAGDEDYFVFGSKKGDRVVIDVQARRLGSPVDSIVSLFDARQNKVAENDDTVDPESPLVTHQADSHLVYSVPAAGDEYVRIRDIQGKGGEEYAYRLSIGYLRPDFVLHTTPDNPRVAGGDSTVLTVTATRRDGFDGEIELTAKDLPPGFLASSAVMGRGQVTALMTITAPLGAKAGVVSPTITGTANIAGRTVSRPAPGTETVMQAFIYNENMPTREIALAVRAGGGLSLAAIPPSSGVLDIPQGGGVPVVVRVVREGKLPADPIELRQVYQGAVVTFQPVTIAADKSEATVTIAVAATAPVGLRQTVLLSGTTHSGKDAVTRMAPAISIRVVPARATHAAATRS